MKIYVASSWRNQYQPAVVKALRDAGHEVYDFRNPPNGGKGFHWSDIDKDWHGWSNVQYRQALEHPIAKAGFQSDMDGLLWCEVCVLVLPCGRSAHLELGWSIGDSKRTYILSIDSHEPELMYKMVDKICISIDELLSELKLYEILRTTRL